MRLCLRAFCGPTLMIMSSMLLNNTTVSLVNHPLSLSEAPEEEKKSLFL